MFLSNEISLVAIFMVINFHSSYGIIGGYEVIPNQYPWMLHLYSINKPVHGTVYFCGASLLSDRWALTARHCVDDNFQNSNLG